MTAPTEMGAVSAPADPVLPGRECGTCSLCCKVYDVPSLNKPAGSWCQHCKPGQGCGIHATRPAHCREFFCFWQSAPMLGPEWKPERCRFVLTLDPVTTFLFVQVDPGQREAWKKDPYYGQLKTWAAAGIERGKQVVVFHNKAATVVLPDKDVDLGVIAPGERVFVTRQPRVGGGWTYHAHKGPPPAGQA